MISLRHLLYGGAFLVACVACREENLVGSVPKMSDLILFDTPSLSVETVSRSTLKNALAPGETFGVLGYCVPYTVGTTEPNYHSASSVWSLKRNQCPPDVFFKQKVIVGVSEWESGWVRAEPLCGIVNVNLGAPAVVSVKG